MKIQYRRTSKFKFVQSFHFKYSKYIQASKVCNYFVPSLLLPWLSLAAAATEAATPVGWVVRYGSFRISALVTPSASRLVAGLSAGNFEVASYKSLYVCNTHAYFQ